MSAADVLRKLRRFLLVLSISLFGGSLLELWLVGHTEGWIQWIPFVLSTAGLLTAGFVLFFPNAVTVGLLRACMAVVVLGTLYGVYEHVAGNLAFAREVDPVASTGTLAKKAVQGGNPLLAPGILAISALLALSATYRYQIKDEGSRQ